MRIRCKAGQLHRPSGWQDLQAVLCWRAQSNAWAGKAGLAAGGREESPELKPDTDGLLSEEWEQNEKQLDRDWYDRCDHHLRFSNLPASLAL